MWAPHKAYILLRREGLIKLPHQLAGLWYGKFSLIHNRPRLMINCVHWSSSYCLLLLTVKSKPLGISCTSWMYYTFLTCDLVPIVMACCLEVGTWFCVPTSNRRYILLFWEQLLSPPGKRRAELAYTGHDFSPPNIKWTDSKVWVGSSLDRISQWYTMIWPDKTTLFMEDSGHVTFCNNWPVVTELHMNTTPLEDMPVTYVWFLEPVIRTATRNIISGGRSDTSFRTL